MTDGHTFSLLHQDLYFVYVILREHAIGVSGVSSGIWNFSFFNPTFKRIAMNTKGLSDLRHREGTICPSLLFFISTLLNTTSQDSWGLFLAFVRLHDG